MYYPNIYIYGVIVFFFAMSWVTDLLIGQYYWLLTGTIPWPGFPIRCKKTHRHLSTCATMMRVQFVYERKLCETKVKMSHALAKLNSNNFAVYGQKHKVWLLVFLVRMSATFWDQNWADLVKFTALQRNRIIYSNSIQEMLLSISLKGLGNKKVISCFGLEQ